MMIHSIINNVYRVRITKQNRVSSFVPSYTYKEDRRSYINCTNGTLICIALSLYFYICVCVCFGTAVLYEGTKDGLNYSNMVSCYNWDADATPCPGPNFAEQNMNYENTDRFSYHEELSCSVSADNTDAVVVVADPTETTDSIDAENAAATTSGSATETAPTGMASESGGNHSSSSLLLITIVTWLFLMTWSTNNIV